MDILKKNIKACCEIKKSRFVTYIYQLENEKQFDEYLTEIKKENPGAKHIVYAYISRDFKMGASEDKEPIDSAHRVLDILKAQKVAGIACFVVRYFGGTLLGASNLSRIYVNCIFDHLPREAFGKNIQMVVFKAEVLNRLFKTFESMLIEAGGEVISQKFCGPRIELEFDLPLTKTIDIDRYPLSKVIKTDKIITKIM